MIVDDGSTDGGPELFAGLDVNPPSPQPSPVKGEGECRSQEASHSTGDSPRVTLIQHPFNLGQGAALSTGFQYALSLGAEFLATFDSDGQYLPEDLEAMQSFLVDHELDIVTGSRFLGRTVGMPLSRKMLVRSSRWLAWALYGLRLTDTQNGVRLMNRCAAEKMLFTQNRMAHAMEAHARVAQSVATFRISEHDDLYRILAVEGARECPRQLEDPVRSLHAGDISSADVGPSAPSDRSGSADGDRGCAEARWFAIAP